MTVKCKICDVRDYETARYCAELGADFLGLHCIWGIKNERAKGLLEIVERFPSEFPRVGLVLVTRTTSFVEVAKMSHTLHPSHVQLHSPDWTGDSILRLRDELGREADPPIVIAVSKVPPASTDLVTDLCRGADILLLDRTQYEESYQQGLVEPAKYQQAIFLAAEHGVPCFIAGGLTPENVRRYLDALKPWGVDVQSGVEMEGQRGHKDTKKLVAFLREVRS